MNAADRAALWAALGLTLLAGCSRAQAPDFAGQYRDDQLTIALTAADGGQYSGTIQRGDQQFALTARAEGQTLRGTFQSGGEPFAFTATLRGGTLTFVTGETTYRLQRQTAPSNPLARGTSPATPREARPASGPAAKVLRLKRVSVLDRPDMIGGEAFSFLAPADWQLEGGVVWRAHPAMPASAALRVFNPAGVEHVELFPTVGFSWGGMLLPQYGFPPGANYMGNTVAPPLAHALAYLKERHLPEVRGSVGARTVDEQELPRLAEAARQAEPATPGSPPVHFTAAKVRIAYTFQGRAVEEDHYCVLQTVTLPQANLVLQVADKRTAVRAPAGELDQMEKLLQTMIHSHRTNLDWYNRYMQLCQILQHQQMQRIRAAGDLSRIISQTHREISDMMRQSYEARQASQDRISRNWSQAFRGVEEYHDPVAGRPVELPSGYQNAWVSGAGEYIVTDNPNFNPNVELRGSWQRLERANP